MEIDEIIEILNDTSCDFHCGYGEEIKTIECKQDCGICEAVREAVKILEKLKTKTDMVAMLTEIQLEIEKVPKYRMTYDSTCVYRKAEEYIADINNIIQQKINTLKEQ